jgi:hypothetical protein
MIAEDDQAGIRNAPVREAGASLSKSAQEADQDEKSKQNSDNEQRVSDSQMKAARGFIAVEPPPHCIRKPARREAQKVQPGAWKIAVVEPP